MPSATRYVILFPTSIGCVADLAPREAAKTFFDKTETSIRSALRLWFCHEEPSAASAS